MEIEIVDAPVMTMDDKRELLLHAMAAINTEDNRAALAEYLEHNSCPIVVTWIEHEEVAAIFMHKRMFGMVAKMRRHGFITSLGNLILGAVCLADFRNPLPLQGMMQIATQDDVQYVVDTLIDLQLTTSNSLLQDFAWGTDPHVLNMLAAAL